MDGSLPFLDHAPQMRMDRMPQMDREVASTTQEEAEKSEMNVEGFRVFRVL